MKAEIIAVGSELLTPDRLDTNSLFLTEELNKLGIEVVRKTVVGDNATICATPLRAHSKRVELVISCGGLGPTADDLTRENRGGACWAGNCSATIASCRPLKRRFRSFRREMPEINVRQAMVPEGAEALDNPRGTAPGLWIEQGERIIVLLPGPPREMRGIFESRVCATIGSAAPRACACFIASCASRDWENRTSNSASRRSTSATRM